MKYKITAIMSLIFFALGALQVFDGVINSYATYRRLAHYAGTEIANKYYLKNHLWQELLIELSFGALLWSLGFYLIRNRFTERCRTAIRYCLVGSLFAFILGMIIEWLY